MKKSARRRKWCIGLVAAVVAVVLLYLWISLRPPLWYYLQVGKPQELPTRLVRPAFRRITGWDLPSKAEKLRAIFSGGRDPSIFVRFQTDSEGILYIREQIAPFDVEFEPFTGTPKFPIVSQWQERFGICILDRRVIESGLRLRYVRVVGVSFKIVIDTQHNNFYMRAVRK